MELIDYIDRVRPDKPLSKEAEERMGRTWDKLREISKNYYVVTEDSKGLDRLRKLYGQRDD